MAGSVEKETEIYNANVHIAGGRYFTMRHLHIPSKIHVLLITLHKGIILIHSFKILHEIGIGIKRQHL